MASPLHNPHARTIQNEPQILESFVSPCSLRNGYALEWGTPVRQVPQKLPAVNREMLEFIAAVGVATRVQLSKFCDNDKKRIAMLAKTGVLTEHRLVGKKRTVVFCAPGPVVSSLGFHWSSGLWEQLSLLEVLKRLVANQLYLRFREVAPVKLFPARPPLIGAMLLNGLDYGVAAVRIGEDGRELKWAEAERMIVIVEELEQALAVAPNIRSPARYTSDRLLFKEPLARAFFRVKSGNLVPETG